MSEGAEPKPPKARLFFALDLPEPVREAIVAWQGRECTDPALRVIPSPALHVTLAFLGYRLERDVDAIAEAALGALSPAPEAPELQFEREPARRPERGRPRLFALAVRSPGAERLQAELSARLETAGMYEPERRPFWPHVTVARVRRAKRGRERPAAVESPPGELPPSLLKPFGAVRIALYRSHLRPQGAEYESLRTLELT